MIWKSSSQTNGTVTVVKARVYGENLRASMLKENKFVTEWAQPMIGSLDTPDWTLNSNYGLTKVRETDDSFLLPIAVCGCDSSLNHA